MKDIIDDSVFNIGRMNSGRLFAELTSTVGWEDFPSYVKDFVELFSGRVISRNDTIDIRLWKVAIGELVLQLVYEDFPLMISLESQSAEGDRFIEALRGQGMFRVFDVKEALIE